MYRTTLWTDVRQSAVIECKAWSLGRPAVAARNVMKCRRVLPK
jgi:hypothetical protein